MVLLDDDFECNVVCPFQAEEASHEVLSRLQHAVLSWRSRDDLGCRIVETAVVVVVEHAAVVQLLSSSSDEDFGAKLIFPAIQKAELSTPGGSPIGCDVMELAPKGAHRARTSRVSSAMSVEHVHLADVGAWRERVLVDTKADRIWEVGR